jgi:hypothetical protein
VHRDYDAAVSVAVKYVRLHTDQMCRSGGVSVSVNAAPKSGTLDSKQDAVCSIQVGSLTSSSPHPTLNKVSATSDYGVG